MSDPQTKIDIESDAGLVLGVILRYQGEADGLMWTSRMLSKALNVTESRTAKACGWLLAREYLARYKGEYIATEPGREYYDGAGLRPCIDAGTSAQQFKQEALSGLVERRNGKVKGMVSEQSPLCRAALPKGGMELHDDATADKILIEIEDRKRARKALAKNCGVDLEDLDGMIADGRIKICGGCEKPAVHHRKGDGVQHLCVGCRKGERK